YARADSGEPREHAPPLAARPSAAPTAHFDWQHRASIIGPIGVSPSTKSHVLSTEIDRQHSTCCNQRFVEHSGHGACRESWVESLGCPRAGPPLLWSTRR